MFVFFFAFKNTEAQVQGNELGEDGGVLFEKEGEGMVTEPESSHLPRVRQYSWNLVVRDALIDPEQTAGFRLTRGRGSLPRARRGGESSPNLRDAPESKSVANVAQVRDDHSSDGRSLKRGGVYNISFYLFMRCVGGSGHDCVSGEVSCGTKEAAEW